MLVNVLKLSKSAWRKLIFINLHLYFWAEVTLSDYSLFFRKIHHFVSPWHVMIPWYCKFPLWHCRFKSWNARSSGFFSLFYFAWILFGYNALMRTNRSQMNVCSCTEGFATNIINSFLFSRDTFHYSLSIIKNVFFSSLSIIQNVFCLHIYNNRGFRHNPSGIHQ